MLRSSEGARKLYEASKELNRLATERLRRRRFVEKEALQLRIAELSACLTVRDKNFFRLQDVIMLVT